MPLFDENSNKLIIHGMKKWKGRHNRFVKISKLVPNYTPKQIASHWKNYLDPNLCLDTLEYEEKKFIAEWIRKYRTSSGVIHWKYVVNDLKIRFGKRHSENKVKNYWNARIKREKKFKNKGQKEIKDENNEQEQGKEMYTEGNERKFIFHFVSSEDFLPRRPSKITIASLLNFDNL
ncbi:hypothetical protein RhiirA5_366724 [Rhizophagus irregularis]|uniref:HTH myb-type domain-containing protein n=2 Tax=Rhizophagus irregularis TaxID=588596 RepID=A0A2I1EKZ3_9GLOM|nr:hypothetical protein RhiirA5_366724 [Rhizophagus irregularis]GBC37408.2 hypothetical protein GLOIN_2v1592789 [Rhizophagus irregularis DAOM 181602=DAOM 197198]PKC61046.1 hypothetical protein RhiirA1_539438 [Rhizophagus irregularis]PKY22794.1 hypothetical protein RhiirB3_526042 [Rhizophagus irregularis]UZO11903.1 hypothetical protein OCT59_003456 [Rhizophagus irregularis]